MNAQKTQIISLLLLAILCLSSCDNPSKAKGDSPRGTPGVSVDTLVFDSLTRTFMLNLICDSTGGANVTFYLCDGDSILQENADGMFSGIAPLEEGYNVQAKVVWSDTTITTPLKHLTGFVVPKEPVAKISISELQGLIDAGERSLSLGTNGAIAQNVEIILSDGQNSSFQDVLLYLKNGVWQSVKVTEVVYDDNNRISKVVITPEITPETSVNINDEDTFVDEY